MTASERVAAAVMLGEPLAFKTIPWRSVLSVAGVEVARVGVAPGNMLNRSVTYDVRWTLRRGPPGTPGPVPQPFAYRAHEWHACVGWVCTVLVSMTGATKDTFAEAQATFYQRCRNDAGDALYVFWGAKRGGQSVTRSDR